MVWLLTLLLAITWSVVAHAQGAAANAVPVSNTGLDALVSQGIISAAMVYAIEGLKKAGWFPWLKPTTNARILKLVGAVVAAATSLGIHFSFDAAVGTLTVTGLLGVSLQEHLYEWLRSWVMQQAFYDRVVDQPKVIAPATVTLVP